MDYYEKGCYACYVERGYRIRHEVYFTDSRTGRAFCYEHVHCLTGWELDGSPVGHSYAEWITPE
jgi:hypothetical protein